MIEKNSLIYCFCKDYPSLVAKKRKLLKIGELWQNENFNIEDDISILHITERIIERDSKTGEVSKNEKNYLRYQFFTFDTIQVTPADFLLDKKFYLSDMSDQINDSSELLKGKIIESLRKECLGIAKFGENSKSFVFTGPEWISSIYHEYK